MVRIGKLLALSVLALELGILDLLAWFSMPIPFGWGSDNLEVNHTLVPWPFLIRLGITVISVILFSYFQRHCVTANREESTKIVTRG